MTSDQLIALLCVLADQQREKERLNARVAELEQQLAAALAERT